MSVVRVVPINNTIGRLDPGNWPFLGLDNWVYAYPAYTRELAEKLANSDADVAAAVNAAQTATQQANQVTLMMNSIVTDIYLNVDPAYTGYVAYSQIRDLVLVEYKVTSPIARWRAPWTRLRLTAPTDMLPANARGTEFMCTGAVMTNSVDATHHWAAGVSEQGHLMLEARWAGRDWPANTWMAGQIIYHTNS